MVLATHLITGAALGQVISNPALAFLSGFLSHFLLDAVPHWDYPLRTHKFDPENPLDPRMAINRDFVFDLAKIFLDLLLGLLVLLLAVNFSAWQLNSAVIWGLIGAVLPDFLQFAYFKLEWPVLKLLQKFHVWIHTDWRLNKRMILGPFLQILLIALVFVILTL